MNRYDSATPWTSASQEYPVGADVVTQVPAREASFVADVLVPLSQAALTGVLVSSLLTFAAVRFWSFEGDRLAFWLGWTLVLTTGTWCLLLRQHRKSLWASESVSGVREQDKGAESRERLVFVDREKARAESEQSRQQDEWFSFLAFVKGLEYKGTALSAWEQDIGRASYCEYRDALLDYGFARWRSYGSDGRANTSQGWTLTVSPGDVLARLSVD